MSLVAAGRRALHGLGVEATRYTPANFGHLRRAEILRSGRVTVFVDGGAAEGKYAAARIADGYRGRIVSFEPRERAYLTLATRAGRGAPPGVWEVRQLGLSDRAGDAELHEAGVSSSIHPTGEERGVERIRVATLDSQLPHVARDDDRLFLKLDLEGHELHALRGATATLERCVAVECEVTVEPPAGRARLEDVVAFLREAGFVMVSFEPSTRTRDGYLSQANAIFLPA